MEKLQYIIEEGKDSRRILAGSKGIGRFARARLGATAEVYLKMKKE
ncbi:hypothetical protein [Bacilliculturomica massiliensis]|nr:hypothetical protein [Bacilliculturomica massiliensis]